jgi:hypothetical protein
MGTRRKQESVSGDATVALVARYRMAMPTLVSNGTTKINVIAWNVLSLSCALTEACEAGW